MGLTRFGKVRRKERGKGVTGFCKEASTVFITKLSEEGR